MPRVKGSTFVLYRTSRRLFSFGVSDRAGDLFWARVGHKVPKWNYKKRNCGGARWPQLASSFKISRVSYKKTSLASETKTGGTKTRAYLHSFFSQLAVQYFFFVKQEVASFTPAVHCGGNGKASVRSLQPCFVVFRSVCLYNPVDSLCVVFATFSLIYRHL